MSNLSDLLPAGAAAKQLTFTDSGSGIATKKPVILNSDGTVAEVSQSSVTEAVGTEAVYYNSTMYLTATTFDSTNNRGVFVYRNQGTPFYVRCVIGTVNGTGAMTYGTEVVVNSTSDAHQPTVVFDSNAGKVVIFYLEGTPSSNLIGRVGTVDPSDNSISFGSPVTVASDASNGPSGGPLAVFDPTNNEILVIFSDNVDSSSKGQVVSVSGTSLSLGSAGGIGGANDGWFGLTYDSGSNKIIFAFQDLSNSYYASCMVGEISGSAPSFPGLVYAFDSSGISGMIGCSYDSTANKTVFVWRDGGQSNRGKAIVGTVTGATSITFGSEVDVNSGRADYLVPIYDPIANKTIVLYCDYNYPSTNNYYGRLVVGTISGTNLTFDSAVNFHASATLYITGAYDSTSNVILINYQDNGNADKGTAKIFQPASTPTNLTATNFVGVADSAISASAAGSVIVQGGTVSGVSSGTGVSKGTAVQYSASNLADIMAADSVYDSTNNKIIVVYDGAGSSAGYGIVGTISGTSISYGSAVQYSGGNAQHSQATYDSTNQRVVVAYADSANSNYLTGVVGTVSGTSISWGTPVVADSTANDLYIGIDFDINAGKVLIIWKDNSTAYNYSIVGTVSGTSISFGTKAAVDTTNGYQQLGGLTYDVNAQKHLFTRPRTSGSASDAYVGTISGTGVSWGSATSISSTEYLYIFRGAYDSNAQKIAIVYRDASASDFSSQVATISGTSVSFGTRAVIDSTISPDFTGSYYDSSDQTIVAFGRATNYYGYIGTISGTSISWGAGQTLILDADFGYGLGSPSYDANADAGLILFANAGGTAAESAVTTAGDLPLTVGTKYYVTTTGGFSSSAGDPSVNAGLAISTTSLLLNGDS